jgi:hypothetical protein
MRRNRRISPLEVPVRFKSESTDIENISPIRSEETETVKFSRQRRPSPLPREPREPRNWETYILLQEEGIAGPTPAKEFVEVLLARHRQILLEEDMSPELVQRCQAQLVALLADPQGLLDYGRLDELTARDGPLSLILSALKHIHSQQACPEPPRPSPFKEVLAKHAHKLAQAQLRLVEDRFAQLSNVMEQKQLDSTSLLHTLRDMARQLAQQRQENEALKRRVKWLEDERLRNFLESAE